MEEDYHQRTSFALDSRLGVSHRLAHLPQAGVVKVADSLFGCFAYRCHCVDQAWSYRRIHLQGAFEPAKLRYLVMDICNPVILDDLGHLLESR